MYTYTYTYVLLKGLIPHGLMSVKYENDERF